MRGAIKMNDDVLKAVENILGRSIDARERGSIDGVLDLADDDLNDIRTIYDYNIVYAISYLMFKSKEKINLMDAKSFCEYIGGQGGSLDGWANMQKKLVTPPRT
jgi:hypothetical protein